jgi:hypothetical protein
MGLDIEVLVELTERRKVFTGRQCLHDEVDAFREPGTVSFGTHAERDVLMDATPAAEADLKAPVGHVVEDQYLLGDAQRIAHCHVDDHWTNPDVLRRLRHRTQILAVCLTGGEGVPTQGLRIHKGRVGPYDRWPT